MNLGWESIGLFSQQPTQSILSLHSSLGLLQCNAFRIIIQSHPPLGSYLEYSYRIWHQNEHLQILYSATWSSTWSSSTSSDRLSSPFMLWSFLVGIRTCSFEIIFIFLSKESNLFGFRINTVSCTNGYPGLELVRLYPDQS